MRIYTASLYASMSLEKAIKHGKERRKPYYGSKAVDPSCARGDCPWCESGARHKNKRREPIEVVYDSPDE